MFKWFKKLIYALPFGLKAADAEIMSSTDNTNGSNITVEKNVNQNTLMEALLRGEVTEEVEEFRYSTYKIDEKANEYQYVGNGQVIKKDVRVKEGDICFTQENKPIVSTVLEDLKHVNDYGDLEKYFINIEYKEFSRFRVNAFITNVDVIIKNNKAKTKVNFSILPDPYNAASAAFINELRKIKDAKDSEYALNRNEIANRISSLTFVTFRASNDEPDMISYAFYGPKFIDYQEDGTSAYIEYEWDGYYRENLRDKFFSKSKEEKYRTNAKRDGSLDLISSQSNVINEMNDLEMLKEIKNKFINDSKKNDKSSN